MKTLKLIGSELLGMFVGDNKLALMTLAVVAVAAGLALALHAPALGGLALTIGCAGVLIESVWRAARR